MNQELLRNKQGLTETEFLQQYDAGKYERPSVTVDMLIFTVLEEAKANYRKLPERVLNLLLIKRGDHPFLGQRALPGGFVNNNESLEAGARRELREETNLERIYLEQLYTWGDVGRDPRARVISCSYLALVDSAALKAQAGDDATDAQWFQVKYQVLAEQKNRSDQGLGAEKLVALTLSSVAETVSAKIKVVEVLEAGRVIRVSREIVESQGIAFDHAQIITYAIECLRNKLEYTDIAFNLMPERFTLSELQQVYEVILDKELLTAAFRRKIAGMVTGTNQFTKDNGHGPLKLYRYNPKRRER
jgi:8-oxo-dGTP diphosphatase